MLIKETTIILTLISINYKIKLKKGEFEVMGTKKGARLLIALFAVCMVCLFSANARADSSQIMVTPDKSGAKVSVVIGDSSMNGQNVSVVCYAPGWKGDTTDWDAGRSYIEYIGQAKVSGTTAVSFPVKGGVQSGNYTLVLGYTGGKVSKTFSFDSGGGGTVSSPAPKSVMAVQSAAKKVKVTWKQVKGASGYTVYRSTKRLGKYTKIATTSKTGYTDKKVKAGKTYYYKVSVSGSGSQSEPAKVTVMKKPKITVKAAKRSAKITWKKDSSASGYRIYKSNKKKGKYKLAATVAGKKKVKATIKKLKSGKTYFFKVSAYKEDGKKKIAGQSSAVKKAKIK